MYRPGRARFCQSRRGGSVRHHGPDQSGGGVGRKRSALPGARRYIAQIVFSSTADGTNDYQNRRFYEFTGLPEGPVTNDTWRGLVHPDDRNRVFDEWRHSVATGKRYDIEYRFRHHSGEYRWMRAMALPLFDDAGRVNRWFGSNTDIHQARLLQTERELVARELDHRIKNVFTLVNALVSLSVRDDLEMAPFAERVRRRLAALNTAHSFIGGGAAPKARSIQHLVQQLLEPYENHQSTRIRMSGEDTYIGEGVVTPLALVFHELATNSAKYGALHTHAGKLDINFAQEEDRFRITWSEDGGTGEQITAGLRGLRHQIARSSCRGPAAGENNPQVDEWVVRR